MTILGMLTAVSLRLAIHIHSPSLRIANKILQISGQDALETPEHVKFHLENSNFFWSIRNFAIIVNCPISLVYWATFLMKMAAFGDIKTIELTNGWALFG